MLGNPCAKIPEPGKFSGLTFTDDQNQSGLHPTDFAFRLAFDEIVYATTSGDIALLANFFLARKQRVLQKPVRKIEREAMDLLCGYSWPGNIRELENIVERALIMTESDTIRPADLPDYIRYLSVKTCRQTGSRIPTLKEQEHRYIYWVLEKCDGNKTKAAEIMGIYRVSL